MKHQVNRIARYLLAHLPCVCICVNWNGFEHEHERALTLLPAYRASSFKMIVSIICVHWNQTGTTSNWFALTSRRWTALLIVCVCVLRCSTDRAHTHAHKWKLAKVEIFFLFLSLSISCFCYYLPCNTYSQQKDTMRWYDIRTTSATQQKPIQFLISHLSFSLF